MADGKTKFSEPKSVKYFTKSIYACLNDASD